MIYNVTKLADIYKTGKSPRIILNSVLILEAGPEHRFFHTLWDFRKKAAPTNFYPNSSVILLIKINFCIN